MKADKVNRIIDDVLCIIAIIIFPLWLLRVLGYERMVFERESNSIFEAD